MFFQDFLKRLKQHKSRILTFTVILLIIAVLGRLSWLLIVTNKPFSITSKNIKEWRNTGLDLLELFAIIIVLCLPILIIYQRTRKGEGWDIIFEIPFKDIKYDTNAISASLKKEIMRIKSVHNSWRDEHLQKGKETDTIVVNQPYPKKKDDSISKKPILSIDPSLESYWKKQELWTLRPTQTSSDSEFAKTVVNIGGTTIPLGSLLLTLFRRDPEYVVRGTLYQFGNTVRLIALMESQKQSSNLGKLTARL
ncbi:hypothetical protein [Nostoc sp. FACHB-133]|uniref:hypothetical protein n=1 Tax=Nostoc sp. FACHB-133 TaxID=2692835 RepID=UPI0016849BA8|nr:hypothetical protein [Nostoc sp. FACHB-133]MBD2524743.1 hypothetical protein [Nostoc sp. FACHB-133]